MKITLEKNNQSAIFNCGADISDDKVRRLIEVLFDLAPQQPSAEVRIQAVQPAGISVGDIPEDNVLYGRWLHQQPSTEVLTALSEFVGYDLNGHIGTVHALLTEAPQFATNLGLWRFLATVEWLYQCGKISYLPIRTSLHSYYNAAQRRAAQ